MRIVVSIALILCFTGPVRADTPLESLWKAFYAAAEAEKFDEPPKIYATDDAHTRMCFIYKGRVWSFVEGKLRPAGHAKMFNVNGVNRILYQHGPGGGVFTLWSNEKLELSFGAG